MTDRPTLASRPAFPDRNPFKAAPLPVPLEGRDLRASDIFRERPLAAHLECNSGWLQTRPRTSKQIAVALFPDFILGGMEPEDVRSLLNRALWDAGYTPSSVGSDNPTWTWTEGN
jgi:hypothetical protein